MPERAHPSDPLWKKQYGLLPSPALAYLQKRYRFCQPYICNKVVLDVPCGTGMGSSFLVKSKVLIGLDVDTDAVNYATSQFSPPYKATLLGNMTSLPFKPGTFDVITCLEGIEHVTRSDGISFLNESRHVLNENGILILSCPLSINGGHSGNPYHLYEWSQDELLLEIKSRFQVIKQKLLNGPAGKVIIVAAKVNQEVNIHKDSALKRLSISTDKTTQWISDKWTKSQACFAASEVDDLLPTCFAILAEETIGTLALWETCHRKAVIETILSKQDSKTGIFAPDAVHNQDLLWPHACDVHYMQYQITYFALCAITALGEKPLYPLKFAHRFLDTAYALGWIEGGPWQDPWNHSNRIMFLLRFLIHLSMDNGSKTQALECYDAIIHDLLSRQDPKTGLWHGFADQSIHNAVYAAYHFFPFMFWRGIQPPHVNRIIDSTLSIQHADGLFGTSAGGGACEDLDAIDILIKFSLISDHRSADVKAALLRAFDRILQIQNDDGGFPNYQGEVYNHKSLKRRLGETLKLDKLLNKPYKPALEWNYYSGWKKIKVQKGHSDMWGAWFRILGLNMIASRYPEIGQVSVDSGFHKLPALGWHDIDAILAAKPLDS